ncbi:hypothetical protein [Terriglobus tenax]|uniref:hypothetical protein n=1 Tax=Terriglobus tenax TaxID=1111115 RepID=UPI0021E01905|nr:hypothetical protein [Terriglobus tenax]
MQKHVYLWSLLIAVLIVGIFAGIASIPGLNFVIFALLPGVLPAALFFPEGIHSSSGIGFMVLAAICDIAIYSLPILWILKGRRANRKRAKT